MDTNNQSQTLPSASSTAPLERNDTDNVQLENLLLVPQPPIVVEPQGLIAAPLQPLMQVEPAQGLIATPPKEQMPKLSNVCFQLVAAPEAVPIATVVETELPEGQATLVTADTLPPLVKDTVLQNPQQLVVVKIEEAKKPYQPITGGIEGRSAHDTIVGSLHTRRANFLRQRPVVQQAGFYATLKMTHNIANYTYAWLSENVEVALQHRQPSSAENFTGCTSINFGECILVESSAGYLYLRIGDRLSLNDCYTSNIANEAVIWSVVSCKKGVLVVMGIGDKIECVVPVHQLRNVGLFTGNIIAKEQQEQQHKSSLEFLQRPLDHNGRRMVMHRNIVDAQVDSPDEGSNLAPQGPKSSRSDGLIRIKKLEEQIADLEAKDVAASKAFKALEKKMDNKAKELTTANKATATVSGKLVASEALLTAARAETTAKANRISQLEDMMMRSSAQHRVMSPPRRAPSPPRRALSPPRRAPSPPRRTSSPDPSLLLARRRREDREDEALRSGREARGTDVRETVRLTMSQRRERKERKRLEEAQVEEEVLNDLGSPPRQRRGLDKRGRSHPKATAPRLTDGSDEEPDESLSSSASSPKVSKRAKSHRSGRKS